MGALPLLPPLHALTFGRCSSPSGVNRSPRVCCWPALMMWSNLRAARVRSDAPDLPLHDMRHSACKLPSLCCEAAAATGTANMPLAGMACRKTMPVAQVDDSHPVVCCELAVLQLLRSLRVWGAVAHMRLRTWCACARGVCGGSVRCVRVQVHWVPSGWLPTRTVDIEVARNDLSVMQALHAHARPLRGRKRCDQSRKRPRHPPAYRAARYEDPRGHGGGQATCVAME
jgi:hypothetical protein